MVAKVYIVKTYQELFRENSHDTILGQFPPENRF